MIRGKYRIRDVAKICTYHFKGREVKVKAVFVYRGSQNIFLSPKQQVRSTPPPFFQRSSCYYLLTAHFLYSVLWIRIGFNAGTDPNQLGRLGSMRIRILVRLFRHKKLYFYPYMKNILYRYVGNRS
jgi:hypothetical protein